MAEKTARLGAEFAARFAAEVNRLSEGRLSKTEMERISRMGPNQLVEAVSVRYPWLSAETIERFGARGPEEFARALAQEEYRQHGESRDVSDRMGWLGGLLDLLSIGPWS